MQRHLRKNEIPDVIRGVTVRDQQIPVDFSMEPQFYGGVTLSEDERSALALLLRFATYSMIDLTHSQA